MSKDEIADKIIEFHEHLNVSNLITDVFRYLAWAFVRGFAWLTVSLENITDRVLLLKNFYQDEDIVNFVATITPFLYLLLALSIMYSGYMLIFNKKFNREGMIVNLFIALSIMILLSTGMNKVNDFTDAAIEVVRTDGISSNESGSLSDSIIKQGIVDLMMYDKNDWKTKELEQKNTVPENKIKYINPKERFTESKTELKLSSTSKEISQYLLTSNNDGFTATKLNQGGLSYNNEFYFRYSVDWFHILMTLGVISFTLLSISIKLARLFFELTFNYILALIIAPADIHNGQKTKTIIQAIVNTFIAVIMIFLSIKIYIIGMEYLEDNVEGVAYIIALIAFSLAVIDGPNMVERLFGIDAGLKSGWSVLTGAYIGSKMIGGVSKGAYNITKGRNEQKPMGIVGGNPRTHVSSNGNESYQNRNTQNSQQQDKPTSPNSKSENNSKQEYTKTNKQNEGFAKENNNSKQNLQTKSDSIINGLNANRPNGSSPSNRSDIGKSGNSYSTGSINGENKKELRDKGRNRGVDK